MLKGVQSVVGHDSGFRVVEDSENAAMAAGFPFEAIVLSHGSKVRKK